MASNSKNLQSIRLVFCLFLLLVIGAANSSSSPKSFLHCMSNHFQSYSTELYLDNQSVHSPDTSSYSTLMSSYHKTRNHSSIPPKQPLFMVTPLYEFEIQAAILCSKNHSLQVRVRSGGHDYEGISSTCHVPFIIIDLVNFRSISVNIDEETAWVQAGATLGEVYYRIAEKSRIHGFPAGICPSVGVGGHISGGGLGTLMRKYGLASDNIIDAYIMDVNGRILNRRWMGEDLFWAIRGGGGASFGVILSWKIKLVRVPPKVTVFTSFILVEEGTVRVVEKWQNIAHKLNENLFIRAIVEIVSGEDKKIQLSFNSLFLGRVEELLPIMEVSFPELGLLAKDCMEMSWIQSVLYFAWYRNGEPLEVLLDRTHTDKSFFKAKSDFVKKPVPGAGLHSVWKRFMEEGTAFVIMDPFGGRMSNISESETPFPHREGNLYNVQYLVKWDEESIKASSEHMQWIRKLYRYMTQYVSSSPRAAYLNYRDLDLGKNKVDGNATYYKAKVWGTKYFKGNFNRLARVKGMVDPDNFFRNEQSIPPLIS